MNGSDSNMFDIHDPSTDATDSVDFKTEIADSTLQYMRLLKYQAKQRNQK